MFGSVKTSKCYPSALNLRLVSAEEQAQYDDLMAKYHRRGALRRIGHELHYVATVDEKWIALISFSPAALKCTARDQWIGWHYQLRTDRLRLIACNSRFLIVPGHHYPNLASRILSGCRRRLATDWQVHFSKPLLLLETFVDSDFHIGTIYQADNWIYVGKTLGYKRIYGGYSQSATESVKFVYVKPLQRNARRILCAPQLPPAYQHRVEKMNLKTNDYHSLFEYFQSINDTRSAQGRRHSLASVLSLVAAAILSGARGYKGIWIWCDELSQANRRRFRCYYWRGKRQVPSITVIRNVMMEVGPDELQRCINDFCTKHFGTPEESIAIDGKVLCGSGGEDQRQTHVMNVIGHDSGFCYGKKKVGTLPVEGFEEEKQSNEIKFFVPTLEQMDITGRTITADAMHTQVKSAEYVVSNGAHFHFSVKGNQPTLLEDVQTWYERDVIGKQLAADFVEKPEKDHGRISHRRIWITDKLNDYVKFPHVKLVFVVQRTVKDPKGKDKDSHEIAFGVTSAGKDETSAQEVLRINRNHWAVESAHNVLDNRNGFDEDASQIRCKNGPENMACMRRFALTVLRHYQQKNDRPITEQLLRLGYRPRTALEYLKLTGNTRPRRKPKPSRQQWLLAT